MLSTGTRIGPAELGVAIGAGRATVRCARRPRVAIVTTGDELTGAGGALVPGQIHDTNGPTLAALAHRAGAEIAGIGHVGDDLAGHARRHRRRRWTPPTSSCSPVASRSARTTTSSRRSPSCGVRELLWRVALRPGKPTWMGASATARSCSACPATRCRRT